MLVSFLFSYPDATTRPNKMQVNLGPRNIVTTIENPMGYAVLHTIATQHILNAHTLIYVNHYVHSYHFYGVC